MKVIKTEQFEKEGNDCLIKSDISLISTNLLFHVIYIKDILSSWLPKHMSHYCENEVFYDYIEAEKYFKKLIDKEKG